jgi:hypothetical protein
VNTSHNAALAVPSESHGSPTDAHSNLAVVSKGIERGRPPERVMYFEDDGGFMVLDEQVPENPAELDRDELMVVCIACLIDRHPAIARGMDVACRGGGLARYTGGRWLAQRLEN